MSSVVFDASTLLILINREPGSDAVSAIGSDIVMSSVNYAEVVTRLAVVRMSRDEIDDVVVGYRLTIAHFTESLAMTAGLLIARSRHKGLSLADRAWAGLDLGIDIRVIR